MSPTDVYYLIFPYSSQALLSNAIIPFTMILAYFWVKERFSKWQILGASTIMAGVSVAMIPTFTSGESSNNQAVFVFLFFLNNLPSAVSSVYKEVAFNDVEMDVNFLQAWVALWQLIFGFVLIPLNTMSILGADRIEYSEMSSAFMNGLWCFLGYNHISLPRCRLPAYMTAHDGTASYALLSTMYSAVSSPAHMHDAHATSPLTAMAVGGLSVDTTMWSDKDFAFADMLSSLDRKARDSLMHSLPVCDDCQGAWLPVVIYLSFNMLYNYFMVVVIKHGGASLMYVIMTLRLPLVQLAFSLPAINNPPDVFGWAELGGLVGILLGLGLYKWGEDGDEKKEDVVVSTALVKSQGNMGFNQAASVQARAHQRWMSMRQRVKKTVHQQRQAYYSKLYGATGNSPFVMAVDHVVRNRGLSVPMTSTSLSSPLHSHSQDGPHMSDVDQRDPEEPLTGFSLLVHSNSNTGLGGSIFPAHIPSSRSSPNALFTHQHDLLQPSSPISPSAQDSLHNVHPTSTSKQGIPLGSASLISTKVNNTSTTILTASPAFPPRSPSISLSRLPANNRLASLSQPQLPFSSASPRHNKP